MNEQDNQPWTLSPWQARLLLRAFRDPKPDLPALVDQDSQIPGETKTRKLELVRAFLRSEAAKAALLSLARTELSGLIPEAVATLRASLSSKNPEVARKAAVQILASAGVILEHQDATGPTRIYVVTEARAGGLSDPPALSRPQLQVPAAEVA